jgi:hypothetical protein
MFFRLQYDQGRSALYTEPISPVFDVDFNQPWWQGQIVETHTFSSTTASQFLLAGSYFAGISKAKDPAKGLSTFPSTLNFAITGTFTGLGGSD